MTDDELREKIAAIPYWYHKIELRPGITTPGWAPLDASKYGVPERLDGETILDVGAWDGYWTFESLKRGAKHVLAIDDFSDTTGEIHNADRSSRWKSLNLCADALSISTGIGFYHASCGFSGFQVLVDDVSIETGNSDCGENLVDWCCACFNRIFCFGLLYHLKNPVLALENCFRMLKPGGAIHVETAILDNLTSPYTGQPHDASGCYAEFYPTNEFGKNSSNWWVPTLKCAAAMLQAAGFVDIETWKLTDEPVHLAQCRGFLRARKP